MHKPDDRMDSQISKLTTLRPILILFVCAIFTSCYSYKIFPGQYRGFTYSGEKRTAYIVNPELKKEHEILKQSGIFEFTDDRSNNATIRIRLHPLKKHWAC